MAHPPGLMYMHAHLSRRVIRLEESLDVMIKVGGFGLLGLPDRYSGPYIVNYHKQLSRP